MRKCKICGKRHSAKGFCKTHYNAFSSGLINAAGEPKPGYFFNEKFHLRKIKDSLRQTVIESPWYRRWRYQLLTEANRKCSVCSKKGVRLYVHHEKRLADILTKARSKYQSIEQQVAYCEKVHTSDIGIVVCRKCHAEKHKEEKMYSSLLGKKKDYECKVCGEEVYCKGFCYYHYGQHRQGVWDKSGKKLRLVKSEKTKSQCVICQRESIGYSGVRLQFCTTHYHQYRRGIINKKGQQLRTIREFSHLPTCKICSCKYYGLGFCLTHYNRFKIGQIDEDGNELRPLGKFCTRKDK